MMHDLIYFKTVRAMCENKTLKNENDRKTWKADKWFVSKKRWVRDRCRVYGNFKGQWKWILMPKVKIRMYGLRLFPCDQHPCCRIHRANDLTFLFLSFLFLFLSLSSVFFSSSASILFLPLLSEFLLSSYTFFLTDPRIKFNKRNWQENSLHTMLTRGRGNCFFLWWLYFFFFACNYGSSRLTRRSKGSQTCTTCILCEKENFLSPVWGMLLEHRLRWASHQVSKNEWSTVAFRKNNVNRSKHQENSSTALILKITVKWSLVLRDIHTV